MSGDAPRDRDEDAAARRASRARRPATRRRRAGVPLLALIVAVVVAFLGGAAIGYVSRGGPDDPQELTLERPVPVVTVTVEAP